MDFYSDRGVQWGRVGPVLVIIFVRGFDDENMLRPAKVTPGGSGL